MEEQKDLLRTQNEFLRNTALPAYTNTVTGAKDVMGNVMPAVTNAANTASDVAGGVGALTGAVGGKALTLGTEELAKLFNPQYEEGQVQGALQTGREDIREQLGNQNAMYGGSGGLGSARMALADTNLRQLGEQRQATAAAAARAGVQANKAAASRELANIGGTNLTNALNAVTSRVNLAGAPQDVYSKYASVVYGIPQASTTPNFQNTAGSTTSGSSKGFGIGK
jgi:hypothetical protein